MAASYPASSPWANTSITNEHLGYFNSRKIGAEADDPLYEVETKYIYRPDLLANELYGSSKLWWVFMQRNLDVMQDPIYDFVPGLLIRLPKRGPLFAALGL